MTKTIPKPNVNSFTETVDIIVGSENALELGKRCTHTMKKMYKLMDMWNKHCGVLGESAHEVVSKSIEELLELLGLDKLNTYGFQGEQTKITLINQKGVEWLNVVYFICVRHGAK